MYGFQVSNTLGEVVISSDTPVYAEHKTFNISPQEARGGVYFYDVPREEKEDLHFYRLPVTGRVGYGRYTPFFNPTGTSFDPIISSSSTLDVKVYRPISLIKNPSTSGYGLEVYDSQGDVTFSSSEKMLVCDSGVVLGDGTQTFTGDFEYLSPSLPVVYKENAGGFFRSYANLFERPSTQQVRQSQFLITTAFTTFPEVPPTPAGALWF